MDIRSLWRVIVSVALIITVPVNLASAFQGNAVAGSVRVTVKVEDKELSLPLEGVTVQVVQDTSITNMIRKDDGVFVLYVPVSAHRQFDLLFTKENYCSAKRRNIVNGDRHKKIEVVTMVPESQIASLSDAEKQQLLNDSAEIYAMSGQAGLTDEARQKIRLAAVRNLTLLRMSVIPNGPLVARPNPSLERQINQVIGPPGE